MIELAQTPVKMTSKELLTSAVMTLFLIQLEKGNAPNSFLSQLCFKPQYGVTSSASKTPSGPLFVRITDIQQGIVDWESVPFCKCEVPSKYELKLGDILVARTGSIGKSFLVTNLPEETAVFASYLIRLQTKSEIFPKFLYWCLQSQQFWQQIMEEHRGSAIKNINAKMLQSLQFSHPSLPIQKCIVRFIETFQERLNGSNTQWPELPPPLDEQRQIVARVEELAAKIEEAQKLRRQAAEGAEAFINSKLSAIFGRLIQENGLNKLDDLIVDAGYGTSIICQYDAVDNSYPVLRIPNIVSEKIDFNDMKYGVLDDRELRRVLVSKDDLLMVRTNGSADLVGRCAVVSELPEPTAFASYLIKIKCDPNIIYSYYLQLMLKYLRTEGKLFDFARTTAGQYNVSLGRLREAKIPVPPLDEQRRIVASLDELQAKVDALKKYQVRTAEELDALLPSVLDRAFRGEL